MLRESAVIAPLYFCTAPSTTVIAPPPVIELSAVIFPEAPASNDKFLSPVATVDLNKMFPAPLPVSIATSPVCVTAFVNVTLSLLVVISPAVVNVPFFAEPNVTAPPAVISPASAIVVTPVASMSLVVPDLIVLLIPIVLAAS